MHFLAGITNVSKSLGAALGPLLTGYLATNQLWSWAFYLAGGLKIVYDLVSASRLCVIWLPC